MMPRGDPLLPVTDATHRGLFCKSVRLFGTSPEAWLLFSLFLFVAFHAPLRLLADRQW
jgi:hypothetical protein